MVDRLTDEQLDELARMDREATAGPWRVGHHPAGIDVSYVESPDRHSDEIATIYSDGSERTAIFIAAARNALPSLLSERQAIHTALRDALTWMGQTNDGDTEERRRILAAGWAALDGRAVNSGGAR